MKVSPTRVIGAALDDLDLARKGWDRYDQADAIVQALNRFGYTITNQEKGESA